MEQLRHVVIGVGAGVFGMHRAALQLETVQLVGVSDINATVGRQRADELGCAFYADYRAMLAETRPDVAVIMTPHPFHAPIAINCLRAGCHVLVEKPLAVQVSEADAMIAAAQQAGRLLAVNFQQRHRPPIQAAHKIISSGQLGDIQHVNMVVVWPRTASYYRSATWRGTWAGEGGGVLMNQAPHNLDLLCWLAGMPQRVIAWNRTLLHNIETEDTAQAMLEWRNGALGALHISTAEAGLPERLDLLGTGGLLQISGDNVTFQRFETDLRMFVAESPNAFAAPVLISVPVALEAGAGDHMAVYTNLHDAILHSAPLMADGVAGRMSLELANAMIFSSQRNCTVDLPLDRAQYAALLDELRGQSRDA